MDTLVLLECDPFTSPNAATGGVLRRHDEVSMNCFETRASVLRYAEELDQSSEIIDLSAQLETRLQFDAKVFEQVLTQADAFSLRPPPGPLSQRTASARWSVPFAASILCHALVFFAVAAFLALSASAGRWRAAHGNPYAQDGSSNPGYALRDDALAQGPAPSPVIAPLPKSSPSSDSAKPAMDQSFGDASCLRWQLDRLPIDDADVVIGIGNAGTSQRLPHFGSLRSRAPMSSPRSATVRPASGAMSPPRIAGPRGQRDGFDSRGLPIPDYPYESQRRGEQGLIVVDVEVLIDGKVGTVCIASDAGYPRLAAAAVAKVKLATFEPARIDGRPVVGHIRIPYRFTLQ
jgi:TonB family protein